MTKDEIIKKLSDMSGRYGSLLIDLLDYTGKISLCQVTEKECQTFYEQLDKDEHVKR